MTIGVWSYSEEFEQEREDILGAVETVFASGTLVLGPALEQFEADFASWHGRAQAIGVDNGTNAIAIALRSLGVGPGDEVITVSNTAAPTAVAIDSIGARPVFVDILDDGSYLMDTSLLEAAISPRTAAVVPVHLFGQCVDMDAVSTVATRHGLKVVEDCAQAHGARFRGQLAGTFGDAAAFSFYPTKVLGAYGDGGAVLTDDLEVGRKARRLRRYGMDEKYYVVETPAWNSRLDEVQAAILGRKLTRLKTYIEARQRVAENYHRNLADSGLQLPITVEGNEHVHYLYVVRHPARDLVLAQMAEQGIELNVSYRWPIHTMSGFARLGYRPEDLPVTLRAANEIFSLPMYPALSYGNQEQVTAKLRRVVRGLGE